MFQVRQYSKEPEQGLEVYPILILWPVPIICYGQKWQEN